MIMEPLRSDIRFFKERNFIPIIEFAIFDGNLIPQFPIPKPRFKSNSSAQTNGMAMPVNKILL